MRKAFLQQKTKEDVREIALYIADDNLVAEAFRLALEHARLTLADLPEIGRAYDFGNRELKGLRHDGGISGARLKNLRDRLGILA
jgi:plasmid stabilization system protein ParE